MSDKLVFQTAIEGLYLQALGSRVTPELKAGLRAKGLDLDRPLPPGLTREVWYACIAEVVRLLFPTVARGEAHRQIGHAMTRGVTQTFWGKAMTPAVRLLGVKRVLEKLPNQMKATNNFSRGVISPGGPSMLVLHVDDVGDAPLVLQGSIEELALWAGAATVTIEVDAARLPAATYTVRWTER